MNELERRHSREKLIESWDDVRNAFDAIRKKEANNFVWHRSILERYKDGRLSLHLHFDGWCVGKPWSRCVEINADCGAAGVSPEATTLANRDLAGFVDASNAQKDGAVFVMVYKDVDTIQHFVPSVVRLNALDYVRRRCWNVAHVLQVRNMLMPVEYRFTVLGSEDRELDLSRFLFGQLSRGVLHCDFPRDVVKARSDIGNTVPDDATQQGRRFFTDDNSSDGQIAVSLSDDVVGLSLQIPPDFFIERLQVLLCPDDLEPGTV